MTENIYIFFDPNITEDIDVVSIQPLVKIFLLVLMGCLFLVRRNLDVGER